MSITDGLDLVHSFLVVAEELNFRRSAEKLHLDQSALSRRIQKLEHLVGCPLLERTTRDVSLTAAGRVFYEENRGLVGGYARSVEMARAVASGFKGSLNVGYMSFAAVELMPRTVALYRQRRPKVALNLKYVRTQGLKVMLVGGDLDVGFLLGPVEHDGLEAVSLRSDRLCVVAPVGHPAVAAAVTDPEEAASHPLVLGDMAEWDFYRSILGEAFRARGLRLAPTFQASNTLALLGLVRAGLGVTILPESLLPALHDGLAAVPIEAEGFRTETVIAWRAGHASVLVRDFVGAATDMIRSDGAPAHAAG